MGDAAAPNVPETVRVHSGSALKFSEIDRVTRNSYTPIVFLTGDVKSGKTTLLGSIHDAFLFGPLCGYLFAGSETLIAFEERCFEARARSGATVADTPRTRYESGQEYLHLKLRKAGPEQPFKNLLFADMSGEFYERAVLSVGELAEFQVLRRSDYLVLLLDGQKLMDDTQRHKVRHQGSQFVRRCREEGLLKDTTALQVLISKWDLVLDALKPDPQKHLDFVTSQFNPAVLGRQVSVTPVASRPAPGSKVDKLSGVKPLFAEWVEATPFAVRPSNVEISIPAAKRNFNRIHSLRFL